VSRGDGDGRPSTRRWPRSHGDGTVTAAEADDDEFARIDAMSIPEWLDSRGPGWRRTSLIRRILERRLHSSEYGLEASEQSIFNLLYLIDYDAPDPFRVFGDSDERFHTHAGNDAFISGLAERLPPTQLVLEHRLVKVGRDGDAYVLTFLTTEDDEVTVTCEHVVFALRSRAYATSI
jgi:monoamine oxidase